jgi:glycosyltransferase involved in cell wall biosynthesis
VIPHGTHALVSESGRPTGDELEVLTWGLVGPGKGIEWAIRAVAHLQDIGVRYRVLGQTHPNVLATDGESYRRSLERLVQRLGLQDAVRFENRYVDLCTLKERVGAAQVIILPYDSLEQVVSGVLAEAIAAHVPVVATPFPHAVEMAEVGAVALADYADPEAMAVALRRLIADPQLRDRMVAAQARLSPQFAWRSVAQMTFKVVHKAIRGVAAA